MLVDRFGAWRRVRTRGSGNGRTGPQGRARRRTGDDSAVSEGLAPMCCSPPWHRVVVGAVVALLAQLFGGLALRRRGDRVDWLTPIVSSVDFASSASPLSLDSR